MKLTHTGSSKQRGGSRIIGLKRKRPLQVTKKNGPGRMKHLELKELAIQDWVRAHRLKVWKVATEANPSDLLTKALSQERLLRHGWELGLRGGPFGLEGWSRHSPLAALGTE